MPWLVDSDVPTANGLAGSLAGARTEADLRRRGLEVLAELVSAVVLTWDRVELTTGAVDHAAVPAGAEPRGAFAAVARDVAGHPLLAAHAACRRPDLRLSDVTERSALARGELYGDLLHGPGVEYEIAIGARSASSPNATATSSTSPARGSRVRCEPRTRARRWSASTRADASPSGGSPGDPHALLPEETVASFRPEALVRLGPAARETEVLRAAAAVDDEAELACELLLSLHAIRESASHTPAIGGAGSVPSRTTGHPGGYLRGRCGPPQTTRGSWSR
jgi:hypothetical protein